MYCVFSTIRRCVHLLMLHSTSLASVFIVAAWFVLLNMQISVGWSSPGWQALQVHPQWGVLAFTLLCFGFFFMGISLRSMRTGVGDAGRSLTIRIPFCPHCKDVRLKPVNYGRFGWGFDCCKCRSQWRFENLRVTFRV